MNVTKYIKEILQKRFENIGFQYHKSAPSEWKFIRLRKGYKEYIVIDKSSWEETPFVANTLLIRILSVVPRLPKGVFVNGTVIRIPKN